MYGVVNLHLAVKVNIHAQFQRFTSFIQPNLTKHKHPNIFFRKFVCGPLPIWGISPIIFQRLTLKTFTKPYWTLNLQNFLYQEHDTLPSGTLYFPSALHMYFTDNISGFPFITKDLYTNILFIVAESNHFIKNVRKHDKIILTRFYKHKPILLLPTALH